MTERTRTLNSYYKHDQNAQGYKYKHERNAEEGGRYKTEVRGTSRNEIYDTKEENFTGRDYTDQTLQQNGTGNWEKVKGSIQNEA